MKTSGSIVRLALLIVLLPFASHARFVQSLDLPTLMKRSQLVFAGQVKSVKASGITTKLTYPTWEGVVFEWLDVEVEVIEPIKGVKKGEVVHTLMLSTRGSEPLIDQPGMVEPKEGQKLLLFLLPTTLVGKYASVTAPFDDNLGVFPLDHQHWTRATYYKDGKEVAFAEQGEKNRAIWELVDDKGEINSKAVEQLRKKYGTEIATPPAKDDVIYLKWKKGKNASGWEWNVPDDGKKLKS